MGIGPRQAGGVPITGRRVRQGLEHDLTRFVDLEEAPIGGLFKLYPWEFILDDDFGRFAMQSLPQTMWIEPLWKTLLSNKAILAILWEMHPGHPNLLPAYLDDPPRVGGLRP